MLSFLLQRHHLRRRQRVKAGITLACMFFTLYVRLKKRTPLLSAVCPDDTEPLDSSDDGYSIEIIGPGSTGQDAEDAFGSYLGTGLEIDDGDSLKLTSNCPSGFGVLLSFMMDVSEISAVNITFITSTGTRILFQVCCRHSLFVHANSIILQPMKLANSIFSRRSIQQMSQRQQRSDICKC